LIIIFGLQRCCKHEWILEEMPPPNTNDKTVFIFNRLWLPNVEQQQQSSISTSAIAFWPTAIASTHCSVYLCT